MRGGGGVGGRGEVGLGVYEGGGLRVGIVRCWGSGGMGFGKTVGGRFGVGASAVRVNHLTGECMKDYLGA